MDNSYPPEAGSLMAILRRLRAPDGCPWDRKQTRESLTGHLAAECGELIDAIDSNDAPHICEELGDVLMNLFFQVVIAEENNEFELADVWKNIIAKMIRRHAHVFGDATADSAEDVAVLWAKIKQSERGDTPVPDSLMDGVKHSLSALTRAEKLQKKAAEAGFDWKNQDGIIAKIREEIGEFESAAAAGEEEHADEELGDLLFAVTNLIRFRSRKSSEELLRSANRKFERRFRRVEELMRAGGRDFQNSSVDELNLWWDQVKKEERSTGIKQ